MEPPPLLSRKLCVYTVRRREFVSTVTVVYTIQTLANRALEDLQNGNNLNEKLPVAKFGYFSRFASPHSPCPSSSVPI